MHDETVYAERSLKAGAKGYIMKNEMSEKCILAIRNVLNGNIYISDKLKGDRFKYSNSPVELLSTRQLEIYQFFGQGLKKSDMANELNLSVKTIETYVENIKKKMNFSSSHEIIMHAINFIKMDNDTK